MNSNTQTEQTPGKDDQRDIDMHSTSDMRATHDPNAIGDFRPPKNSKRPLHIAESTGTYRLESAVGFPDSNPGSPMGMGAVGTLDNMKSRMLQKDRKRSEIIDRELPYEPAGGGCCQGKQCHIF